MRIIDLVSGIQVPITNEEADLLLRLHEDVTEIARRDLNEREIMVANSMVNKDVLSRTNKDGRIVYRKK
jgi:hypothetical protein